MEQSCQKSWEGSEHPEAAFDIQHAPYCELLPTLYRASSFSAATAGGDLGPRLKAYLRQAPPEPAVRSHHASCFAVVPNRDGIPSRSKRAAAVFAPLSLSTGRMRPVKKICRFQGR